MASVFIPAELSKLVVFEIAKASEPSWRHDIVETAFARSSSGTWPETKSSDMIFLCPAANVFVI